MYDLKMLMYGLLNLVKYVIECVVYINLMLIQVSFECIKYMARGLDSLMTDFTTHTYNLAIRLRDEITEAGE